MTRFDEKGEVKSRVVIGKRVYLRPLAKEDLVYLRKWSDDAEIRGLTGEVASMSEADAEKFLEKVRADTERAWFMVVIKENSRVIGEAGLLRMFPAWRTTDMSVIIGEKEEWGKGYGTETILLLLDYAFRQLNFHRVAIGVVGFNERAIRFWEKVGFRKEGIERDGYYYDHKYYDFVMMSILDDEFRELHGGNSS
ncbi:GNAT family N-acetyltransferase [Candidatus Micrarchaeota archaeon]|nr:GNAT family N-acetyltransferase [Candidatus Micrarchaeota archaeon]